jgi:hypothetical protein
MLRLISAAWRTASARRSMSSAADCAPQLQAKPGSNGIAERMPLIRLRRFKSVTADEDRGGMPPHAVSYHVLRLPSFCSRSPGRAVEE